MYILEQKINILVNLGLKPLTLKVPIPDKKKKLS